MHSILSQRTEATLSTQLAVAMTHLVSVCIQSVLVGEDSNSLHCQFMSGSEHSDSDFTSVGNEDLLERTTSVVCDCATDTSYCSCWMRRLEARRRAQSTSRCSWERVAGTRHGRQHGVEL